MRSFGLSRVLIIVVSLIVTSCSDDTPVGMVDLQCDNKSYGQLVIDLGQTVALRASFESTSPTDAVCAKRATEFGWVHWDSKGSVAPLAPIWIAEGSICVARATFRSQTTGSVTIGIRSDPSGKVCWIQTVDDRDGGVDAIRSDGHLDGPPADGRGDAGADGLEDISPDVFSDGTPQDGQVDSGPDLVDARPPDLVDARPDLADDVLVDS